jgi:hypothetical protein
MRRNLFIAALGLAIGCGHPEPPRTIVAHTPCPIREAAHPDRPSPEEVAAALGAVRCEVARCSDARFNLIEQIAVVIHGNSGHIRELRDTGESLDPECLARVFADVCLPQFDRDSFIVGFPYRVGPRVDGCE